MGKKNKDKRDALWAEATRRCRLSVEELRMAKEMGLNPRSLIKNIPSKSEPWKAPVKDWVREMYRKRQEKAERTKKRRADSGDTPFLRQHEEFHFDPNGLRPGRVVVLFDRSSTRDTGGSQGQIPL